MADDTDNSHFKNLLDLVPAHFHFTEEEKHLIRNTESDGDQVQFGGSGVKLSKKRKHQDPLTSQSVSILQTALSAREEKIKGKKESKQKRKKEKVKNGTAGNIQEAQEKLRARIAELQAKRNQGLSSVELQERKRLERKQKRLNANKKNKNKKKDGSNKPDDSEIVDQPLDVSKPPKPIVNKEGKIVFSKFDFKQSGQKEKSSELEGKDYKRILARLEQREAKVAKVKETDTDAASKLEQKHVWQDVLMKAKGAKVKDDPSRLKKAIKRKDKMQDHRKKVWGDREQTVQTHFAKKQEKREGNLQKRKDDKKAKHRKKLIKKGRIFPGF